MSRDSWSPRILGDVLTLHRGYDLPSRERRDGEVPIVSSSGVTGYHHLAKVSAPGVVTGRYGTLGAVFLVKKPFWPLNTTLYVSDFKGNDPVWVSYLLRQLDLGRHQAAAAVPGVNRNVLHQLPVLLPPLGTQRAIASILSAFDELIENDTRRIEILEETAQAIYREWFVNFRYPGHEDVPLVDSELGPIPEGWTTRSFSELAAFFNGYAFKPTDWGNEGRPIVKIKELKAGISADTPRFSGHLDPKYEINDGDLLFSWSADLDAYLWGDGPGWLNQHLFKVTPHEVSVLWLYHALSDRMGEFRLRSQGTTMKHIKRSALDQVRVTRPPDSLVASFAGAAEPLDSLKANLIRATRTIRATRDLLLPRLISGEVDVSDLDIDVGELVS